MEKVLVVISVLWYMDPPKGVYFLHSKMAATVVCSFL